MKRGVKRSRPGNPMADRPVRVVIDLLAMIAGFSGKLGRTALLQVARHWNDGVWAYRYTHCCMAFTVGTLETIFWNWSFRDSMPLVRHFNRMQNVYVVPDHGLSPVILAGIRTSNTFQAVRTLYLSQLFPFVHEVFPRVTVLTFNTENGSRRFAAGWHIPLSVWSLRQCTVGGNVSLSKEQARALSRSPSLTYLDISNGNLMYQGFIHLQTLHIPNMGDYAYELPSLTTLRVECADGSWLTTHATQLRSLQIKNTRAEGPDAWQILRFVRETTGLFGEARRLPHAITCIDTSMLPRASDLASLHNLRHVLVGRPLGNGMRIPSVTRACVRNFGVGLDSVYSTFPNLEVLILVAGCYDDGDARPFRPFRPPPAGSTRLRGVVLKTSDSAGHWIYDSFKTYPFDWIILGTSQKGHDYTITHCVKQVHYLDAANWNYGYKSWGTSAFQLNPPQ